MANSDGLFESKGVDDLENVIGIHVPIDYGRVLEKQDARYRVNRMFADLQSKHVLAIISILQVFAKMSLFKTALSPWFRQSKAYMGPLVQRGLMRAMTGSQISLWKPLA